MSISPGTLTAVRWSELCPWLLLVRAARVAFLVRVVLLAVIGVFATQWGWSAIERTFVRDAAYQPLAQLTEHPPASLLGPDAPAGPFTTQPFELVDRHPWSGPFVRGWAWAVQPLTRLVDASGWRTVLALILAGAWVMAVWALIGGAIARIAALYLARGEHLGPIAALQSAVKFWPSTIAAPLFCFAIITVFVLLLAFVGLTMRWGPMAFLSGLFWPLLLLMGVATAVFAIGLLAGWPLMGATVAVERTDAFDAVSRGYAFTFQRPLHWVFYLLVATVLGLLAQTAASLMVGAALNATDRAVSWGLNDQTDYGAAILHGHTPPEGKQLGLFPSAGGKLVRFWTAGLSALATAFPMAFLFPTATGIYLLLRRQIDSTELGEVSLEDNPPEAGLPPLTTDPATGIPAIVPQPVPPAIGETTVAAAPAATPEPSVTVTELRGGST